MQELLSNLRINIPSSVYLKDPESSDLGKRIIEHSIVLIDGIGFEAFTFKKLGEVIGSNESSIYRYFENKHKLLMYLCSWYWGWLEYQLVLTTFSLKDPREKLEKTIEVISRKVTEDSTFTYVNEPLLSRIIIHENSKSFMTKQVDTENQEGGFESYKRLIQRVYTHIEAVAPDYAYPKSLASTLVETALHQHYLRDHFKSITDCGEEAPTAFLSELLQKTIA
ncbi:MAG: TetR/AcrR family transcriptional regulator [Flavobacteriaceae bacterium]